MAGPSGSQRGPVALPVFKTGDVPPGGTAGFDSQGLPPTPSHANGRTPGGACGRRHEPGARDVRRASGVDQADFTRPGPLGRLLDRELHALALAQELEDGPADGGAVEEVLHPRFVPDEAEALVDEQACD